MTKAAKTAHKETGLSRPLQRALEDLCGEGAYGVLDSGSGEIAIAAARKGVSVRIACAGAEIVAELIARDLACVETGARSGRKRLLVNQAGRSALARAGKCFSGAAPRARSAEGARWRQGCYE